MEIPALWEKISNYIRNSLMVRLFSLGFIILILLIPTSMIRDLVKEREGLRSQAEDEVSSKWGGAQTLGGPVLAIPYWHSYLNSDGKRITERRTAFVLPDEIVVSGAVKPEERHRGIYVVALYNTQLAWKGKFPALNAVALGIAPEDLLLGEAYVMFGLTDLRGIRDRLVLTVDGQKKEFQPGVPSDELFASGVSVPVQPKWASGFDFTFDLNVNGARELSFLPFGKETRVSLTSPWSHPGFEGDFLPSERSIDSKGFTATWKVFHLNRNYPQTWTGDAHKTQFKFGSRSMRDDSESGAVSSDNRGSGRFGVRFLLPVDEYKKTDRAAKYSALFILLTFLAYFFIEVIQKKRAHPVQYFLVGAALCLFYLLLLSVSEHLTFNIAYLLASVVILTMVASYTRAIFQSTKASLSITGILVIFYGFFYSLLQIQDYALLLGSLGLLVILGIIMALTRKIDWNRLGSTPVAPKE